MNYKIKFDESVLLDFNDRIRHYDDISINLGDKLHAEFWNKIDYIKNIHYIIPLNINKCELQT